MDGSWATRQGGRERGRTERSQGDYYTRDREGLSYAVDDDRSLQYSPSRAHHDNIHDTGSYAPESTSNNDPQISQYASSSSDFQPPQPEYHHNQGYHWPQDGGVADQDPPSPGSYGQISHQEYAKYHSESLQRVEMDQVYSQQHPGMQSSRDADPRAGYTGLSSASLSHPYEYPLQPHQMDHPPYRGPIVDDNPFAHQQQQQQHMLYAQQQEMQIRLMQEQQAQAMQWSQRGGRGQWYNSQMGMPYPDQGYGGHRMIQNAHGARHSVATAATDAARPLGYMRSNSQSESIGSSSKIRRTTTKREKDPDKPKRPLSAYNLFFKDERAKMLAELGVDESKKQGDNGFNDDDNSRKRKAESDGREKSSKKSKGVGFAPMAKRIAAKWKEINDQSLEKYKEEAAADMERYRIEMDAYRKKQREGLVRSREESEEGAAEESTEGKNGRS